MNRRTFIESSLASVAVTSLPLRGLAAAHQLDSIGVELYTVRALMKTDVPGTLAKVAAIGYKEVEFAGYFDYSPKDLRALLDKNGLTAPACHVSYAVVQNKWPETVEAGRILGHKLPYDYLLESTDPANLKMELDLCWITVAGKDPLAYFKKYPGRFKLVHVKDLSKIPPIDPRKASKEMIDEVAKNFTAIGGGVINWKVLLPAAQDAGVKHFFVENDEPKDAIANLTDSYAYLSKLRF